MDINNINIEDIKAKLLSLDKKVVIKYGSIFGASLLFLIIYYAILNPIVEGKKVLLSEMNLKKEEIINFKKNLITINKRIKKIKPLYEKNSTLFHTREEVEGLYQTLSQYAGINGLTVSKINKKEPRPVFTNSKGEIAKKKPKKATKLNISYYVIPVDFEIRGNFLGYIKFKRELSKSDKMLNFDKEVIKLENDKSGAIVISGELSIVGVTSDFF
jgi:Tfp pilus assembly protein PilO|tara:strand:+ start:168 stop:812 length:645 start_codon:yes stop_codon:yes gene_type:complete